MITLTIGVLVGAPGVEPVIAAGSTLVLAGLLVFTVNVLKNARRADVGERAQARTGT